MRVVRDLAIGQAPSPMDILFNPQSDADGSEVCYRGQLTKLVDRDSTNGLFVCKAGETTAYENIFGILEEHIPAAAGSGYLFPTATYSMKRRKITPILPTSVIRAEYSRKDAAGTDNYDTGATGALAGTVFTTAAVTTTSDQMIGGWVYFLNGACKDYLHFVSDSDQSDNTIDFTTGLAAAVVGADDWLVIQPPMAHMLLLDATLTGLLSEVDYNSLTLGVIGLNTLMSSPGHELQYLDQAKHDGLKIANARFWHDFVITGVGDVAASGSALALTRGYTLIS